MHGRAVIAAVGFITAALAAGGATKDATGSEVEMLSLEFGSLTIHSENDKYFAGTDRNYTNGFKISALSANLRSFRDRDVPGLLRNVAKQVDGFIEPEREPKIGLALGQNIYTPTDTQATAYQPNDRPYAAWLYFGASFHNYRPHRVHPDGTTGPARVDIFEVNFGVVGPAALGRQVQNAVHRLIDVPTAKGWANQLHNEPGLNLIYETKLRFSSSRARTNWGIDFIPHAGVCLGNVATYLNAGGELRAGYRLPDDFGTSLIRPSGESNSDRRRSLSLFVFVMAEGRAVARDITLDGNTFRDSPSIDKKPFVHDLSAGLGLGVRHVQITYTQARRSLEFEGQAEPQDFGSVSIAYFF